MIRPLVYLFSNARNDLIRLHHASDNPATKKDIQARIDKSDEGLKRKKAKKSTGDTET